MTQMENFSMCQATLQYTVPNKPAQTKIWLLTYQAPQFLRVIANHMVNTHQMDVGLHEPVAPIMSKFDNGDTFVDANGNTYTFAPLKDGYHYQAQELL